MSARKSIAIESLSHLTAIPVATRIDHPGRPA